MTRKSAALAVFVKSPGLSPIKTRLAAGLGREKSDVFYKLSVAAVASTITEVSLATGLHPYWAVAEKQGLSHPLWSKFPRLWQGDGDLGSRLARIFGELQEKYSVVVAIGADAPQLTTTSLITTLLKLSEARSPIAHVVGRSLDGGFYLVGTKQQLSQATWCDIPYSVDTTADELIKKLRLTGEIYELNYLTDVDEKYDLCALRNELLEITQPNAEQLALLEWLDFIQVTCPSET